MPLDQAHMQAYYQTYNSEDAEALAAFYDPEVELHSAEGVMQGVEAILATYQHLTSLFHDQMTPESISIDGNIAEVVITDCFTAKQPVDDFMGATLAEGETLTLKLHGRYEYEDGRFTTITISALQE